MRVPEQVTRIVAVMAVLAIGAVALRFYVIPRSYFSRSLHRQSTVEREVAKPIKFAGSQECRECHDDIFDTKSRGYHKTLGCESCHSPGVKHADEPYSAKAGSPQARKFCPVCHAYDSARPTGFPQINPTLHNPRKPCIKCHNPHDPVPPHVPRACSACHAQIARTKDVSSHALLGCAVCHTVSQQHRITPRNAVPTKPETRESCGKCHAEGSRDADIPKVDMEEHGGNYLCWQCHYAHLPEGS